MAPINTATARAGAVDGEDLRSSRSATKSRRRVQGFTCERCGDVIGVYEPLVIVTSTLARTTSRAAEPDLPSAFGDHYHGDCYAEMIKAAG